MRRALRPLRSGVRRLYPLWNVYVDRVAGAGPCRSISPFYFGMWRFIYPLILGSHDLWCRLSRPYLLYPISQDNGNFMRERNEPPGHVKPARRALTRSSFFYASTKEFNPIPVRSYSNLPWQSTTVWRGWTNRLAVCAHAVASDYCDNGGLLQGFAQFYRLDLSIAIFTNTHSKEVHDFFYGEGANPFRTRKSLMEGMGTIRDTLNPNHDRPSVKFSSLQQMGYLKQTS